MSLPLPANMAKAMGKTEGDESTVRDVREASLLEGIEALTYAQFAEWMHKHGPAGGVENIAFKSIVETVDEREGTKDPLIAKGECDPNA
jgi:hypothetical protein